MTLNIGCHFLFCYHILHRTQLAPVLLSKGSSCKAHKKPSAQHTKAYVSSSVIEVQRSKCYLFTSNIAAVRLASNNAVSENHKSRIRAKHCLHSLGVDILTTDLLTVGKRMVCRAGNRLWSEADDGCLLRSRLLDYRAKAFFTRV